jgi:hypothetical protein
VISPFDRGPYLKAEQKVGRYIDYWYRLERLVVLSPLVFLTVAVVQALFTKIFWPVKAGVFFVIIGLILGRLCYSRWKHGFEVKRHMIDVVGKMHLRRIREKVSSYSQSQMN